jgi:hypothetical protein
MCVRWCEAYQLRLCHLGQMMAERGIEIDHSTAHRRAINLLPVMENACRRHLRSVGKNRRVDETRRHPWRTATARARRRRRNRLRRRALGRMGRRQPDERSPEPRGHGPRHGLADVRADARHLRASEHRHSVRTDRAFDGTPVTLIIISHLLAETPFDYRPIAARYPSTRDVA